MTRINVGVNPKELCDQHLLAEIRELPRVIGTTIATKAPAQFKLGSGHVAWCAQFQASLSSRLEQLKDEAKSRGFKHDVELKREPHNDREWSESDARIAADICRERIKERLGKMESHPKKQFHPRWTKRV